MKGGQFFHGIRGLEKWYKNNVNDKYKQNDGKDWHVKLNKNNHIKRN